MGATSVLVLSCFALTVSLINPTSAADDITTKLMQSMDLAPMLANKAMINSMMGCLLETGPCDAFGNTVKKDAAEVLETSCEACPEEKLMMLKKVMEVFVPNYPDEFQQFLSKYDPQGQYWPALKAKLQIA